MPTCAHSGCKREFSAEENNATACQYHPGTPVFHEGFKSWSCCNKKRASFEEFMAEPGCTLGFHEIEPENTKGSKVKLETPEKHDEIQVMKESDKRKINKKDESYKTSDLSKEFTNIKVDDGEKVEKTPVLEEDPEDAEIAPGTCCRRKGCGKSFIDNNTSRDPSSQDSICIYHSGVPVFHEGSKGWSCFDPISWPSLGPTENITTWTTFGKGDSPLPEVTRNK
ncbi:Cysteine and histidine-rich domain-containing protein 1 [Zancudomyces culisetae]|uniref:Cysteine and histidine-rich domain-containing protein 1 n=1 Tax=Zancudomyces culisetae TaxID=1213189 RepID=A0A1R1PIE9_ZANCU|nr:Cysteine and histidine-rich domain-containing protein 1 [Zancudomyces culisetae]|eukprot:OMH80761.1 Cysteine and histidine-rich domain-containing protein 1 [Zancudomyces culisetae]